VFIHNLESLSTEELTTLAATLTEVTASTLIELQIKTWVKRSPNTRGRMRQSADALLQKRIEQRSEQLRRLELPDDSLRWIIRQQLAVRVHKTRSRDLIGDTELAWAVLRHIAPLYQIRIRPTTSIDWLEQEVFRRFIRELGEKIEEELRTVEKDPARIDYLEDEIERRLQALSRGEREALQRDLGLTHLTGHELRVFATRGGLTTAALAGAASTGMGLYLATTTITHALATTLLGITLPFAAYTTLTSALALLLSPVGALVLVGGGGLIQWSKLRRAVDRRVLLHAFVMLVQGGFVPAATGEEPQGSGENGKSCRG